MLEMITRGSLLRLNLPPWNTQRRKRYRPLDATLTLTLSHSPILAIPRLVQLLKAGSVNETKIPSSIATLPVA